MSAMSAMSADAVATLAPGGRLRAAINLGNPLLARRDGQARPEGVSIDLAEELARQLGVGLDLVVLDTAGAAVAAVSGNGAGEAAATADVGFFAVDPARGATIAFTAPYLLIEGSYLVRSDSPLQANEEVDRPGRRVVVGQASAYDLYLSRSLQHAAIVRAPSSQEVVATFMAQNADVAAGVRQQLEADAAGETGLRLLDGCFMTISQAMGVARGRGPLAQQALHAFVEAMKSSGFMAAALARHAVKGAALAPAAPWPPA